MCDYNVFYNFLNDTESQIQPNKLTAILQLKTNNNNAHTSTSTHKPQISDHNTIAIKLKLNLHTSNKKYSRSKTQ